MARMVAATNRPSSTGIRLKNRISSNACRIVANSSESVKIRR
jgi:hypothetical protein